MCARTRRRCCKEQLCISKKTRKSHSGVVCEADQRRGSTCCDHCRHAVCLWIDLETQFLFAAGILAEDVRRNPLVLSGPERLARLRLLAGRPAKKSAAAR